MNVQALSDALWATLAAFLVALLACSHLPRTVVIRLSVLVRRAEVHRSIYALVMIGWMWLGWHLFAR